MSRGSLHVLTAVLQAEYRVSVSWFRRVRADPSFFIPCAAALLLYTQIMSIFPPRYVYLAALIIFMVGNAVSGSAHSMTALLVGRSVSALGGAGMWK